MTYEEAIEVLKNTRKFFNIEAKEAIDLAIEALQKQVPMKANKTRSYVRFCSKCEAVLTSSFKYCDECGQRIDWGDEK